MGAPIGNTNAAKGRKWREAIMRALARKSGSVEKGLDDAADKLVKLIHEGTVEDCQWAIDHIADRLDGRPAQAIIGGDEDDPPLVHRVERVIVRARPDATDG